MHQISKEDLHVIEDANSYNLYIDDSKTNINLDTLIDWRDETFPALASKQTSHLRDREIEDYFAKLKAYALILHSQHLKLSTIQEYYDLDLNFFDSLSTESTVKFKPLLWFSDKSERQNVTEIAVRILEENGQTTELPHCSIDEDQLRADKHMVPIVLRDNEQTVRMERQLTVDMTSNWQHECLSATSHCLEAGKLFGIDLYPSEEHKSAVLAWVQSLSNGGLFRAYEGTSDASLYDTHAAISILKSCLDQSCEERLNIDRLKDKPGVIDMITAMHSAALDKTKNILGIGTAKPSSDYTVIDLHHALSIIWHTDYLIVDGRIERRSTKDILDANFPNFGQYALSFITSLKIVDAKTGKSTFSIAAESNIACVSAIYFVNRICKHLELLSDELVSYFVDSKKYIEECYDRTLKGYGSQPGDSADMVHTYLAVQFFKNMGCENVIEEKRAGIASFLNRCYKNGGYAIAPEWRPSAYGTRLALQTLKVLGLPNPPIYYSENFLRELQTGTGFQGYSDKFARYLL